MVCICFCVCVYIYIYISFLTLKLFVNSWFWYSSNLFYFVIEKINISPPNHRWERRNFEMQGVEDVWDNLCQH